MPPTSDEIRLQLDRILASEAFSNADRLSRFVRYVVERALAGEGATLKEYVIGTEVFDRGESYDPRLDSIVRVEAGRLRTKLEEYYNHQGLADTVLIRIPRGSYAPEFAQRPAPPAAAAARPAAAARHGDLDAPVTQETPRQQTPEPQTSEQTLRRRIAFGVAAVLLVTAVAAWRSGPWTPAASTKPRIAVLPFTTFSTDPATVSLAARLTDGVTSELARVGTVDVVSYTSAQQFGGMRRSLRDIARALNADLVVEASVTIEGDRVNVPTRLVDAALDRKVWVEEFAAAVSDVRELQRRIAVATAAATTTRKR